ncbi:MAG: hypothetical protein OHK0052_12890 [Anaerolineales bacterium]
MNRFNRPSTGWLTLLSVVLGLAVLIGLTSVNLNFTRQNPGGNDFLVQWVGTRALLIDGLSPYDPQVSLRIQQMVYSRPAQTGENEMVYVYPLYSQIFFVPFALFADYALARALWMTTLQVLFVTVGLLSLRLTRWQPAPWLLGVYLLFTVLWYHGVRTIINGNEVGLTAFFVVAALLATRANLDELAGILAAFSTIKPQIVVLWIPLLLLWAFSWRRWRLIAWFFGSMALLIGLGILFVPDWLWQNLREILRYPGYNPPGSPQAVFALYLPGAGRQLGLGLSIFLGLVMLSEWVLAWRKEFNAFLWTSCLTLLITQWSGIQTDPGNFIVLFLPLVLVWAMLEKRYGAPARWVNLALILLLLIGLWWIFIATIEYGDQPVQSPLMFFPLPLFLFIGLYWVRWWAVRSDPPTLDIRGLR